MTLTIREDPVPLRVDEYGTVRVGGTRVTLETVLARYLIGEPPEEIAQGFNTLALADIYRVISYYLRHREEVDAYLKQVDEKEQAAIRRIESQPGYKEIRERILARAAAQRLRR